MSGDPYRWPKSREWAKWTKERKLERAKELMEQADRQRSPMMPEGVPTPAQNKARGLLRLAEAEAE